MISRLISIRVYKFCTQLLALLGIVFFYNSCSSETSECDIKDDKLNQEVISHIYSYYTDGNLNKYVNHIASCHGKPRYYREQMIDAYKQQFTEQCNTLGSIDSFKVESITINKSGDYATVLIRNYYSNTTPVTTIIQFVNTKKQGWMIK